MRCESGCERALRVTGVAAERVQALAPLTVRDVDVAVPRPRADQGRAARAAALHEGQVPDGPVVHAELQVRPCSTHTQTHARIYAHTHSRTHTLKAQERDGILVEHRYVAEIGD